MRSVHPKGVASKKGRFIIFELNLGVFGKEHSRGKLKNGENEGPRHSS